MANIATSGSGGAPKERKMNRLYNRPRVTVAAKPSGTIYPNGGVGQVNAAKGTPSSVLPTTGANTVKPALAGAVATSPATPAPVASAPSIPASVKPAASSMANNVQGAALGNAAASAFGKEMNALSGSPTIKKGTPAIKPVQPVKRATK